MINDEWLMVNELQNFFIYDSSSFISPILHF